MSDPIRRDEIQTWMNFVPATASLWPVDETPSELHFLASQGFRIFNLAEARDLRFLSAKTVQNPESRAATSIAFPSRGLDSILLGRSAQKFSLVELQRVTATLFTALAPRTGILELCLEAESFEPKALLSMMSQNGFEPLETLSRGSSCQLISRRS